MFTPHRHSVQSRLLRRAILTAAILPAAIVCKTSAVDWIGNVTLNVDPTVAPGLVEGRVDGSPFDIFTPNPGNGPDNGLGSGVSLNIRMGQDTTNFAQGTTGNPDDFWNDNRTWIYTGEINSGPSGLLSFAESIDDSTQIRIDGTVVLQDGAWNVPTATPVLPFTPNTFHTIEIRMGNGVGGAGPVAVSNFATNYGFGFSQSGATGTNGASYTQPLDPGTGTLFHHITADAIDANQAIDVLAPTLTVTLNKLTNDHITESSITFSPSTGSATTMTVNGSTPGGELRSLTTVLGTSTGAKTITINGDADFAPGAISLGTATSATIVKTTGAGKLILDNNANALLGCQLRIEDGTISVVGSGGTTTPISSMGATAVSVNILGNASGTFNPVLRLGGGVTPTTFNNRVTVTNNGTIEHVSPAMDILSSGVTTIGLTPGKTLTFNITGGGLTVNGAVAHPSSGSLAGGIIRKLGNNMTLRFNGTTFVTAVNAAEGRLEFGGQLKLNAPQTISIGANATLALLNPQATSGQYNQLPATITVTSGTLEALPGALSSNLSTGAPSSVVLQGGALSLGPGPATVSTGLIANLYTGNDSGASGAFNTFTNYLNHFLSRGLGTVTNTGANGVAALEYGLPADGQSDPGPAMFSTIAPSFTATNNIVSRFHGKIRITTPGTYTFGTDSDDGSMLYINGATVVSNNFYQAHTRREGAVTLCAGLHDIDIGFYEGGGLNSLVVDWAGPGISGRQSIPNSVLVPVPSETTAYTNPVSVTQNSSINANGVSVPSVNLSAGRTLTVNGYRFSMGALTLNGGAGTYTVDTATEFGESYLTSVTDSGAAVALVKNGLGTLVIEAGVNPQFQNAGSSITANAGAIGLVLGPVSPIGNATLNVSGAGLALSSKGGDQTMALPAFSNGGSISAGKLGSGVAGTVGTPIRTTLTGNIALNASTTLNLSTRDNYILALGGISGNATVNQNGGVIETSGPISIGNGPLNIVCTQFTAAQSIAAGPITISGSTVSGSSSIAGTGAVSVTDSTVTANGALAGSSFTVNGSTITNFGNISLGSGMTITGGSLAPSQLNVNGGSITGGPINAQGAIIHAATGITNAATTATFTGSNPSGLAGRFIFTGGHGIRIPPNTDAGILAVRTGTDNLVERILTGALNFPTNADASISAFFGGADTENGASGFAIGFFGSFTAPATGLYQMQTASVDDDAGFWVDLNDNGIFESAGSAGNELIARMSCCGDGAVGSVTLAAGHTYNVAMAVEDGQGGSGIVARIAAPGGPLLTVNPSDPVQSGWWTYGQSNQVTVDAGAALNIQAINGTVRVTSNGSLGLTGAGNSSMDSLTIGAMGFVKVGGTVPAPEAAGAELNAVPEPGTLGLLLASTLGLLGRRRRDGRL